MQPVNDPLAPIWPQLVPSEITSEQQAHATAALEGELMFLFHGYNPVQVGLKSIDWAGKHLQHQEWPAQLNRFYMLRPLLAAWQQTGQEQYARAARLYLQDWLQARPTKEDWTLGAGDNTLTLALRLGNSTFPGWGRALFAFAGSEAFDEDLVLRVKDSLRVQLNFLLNHLTEEGNWRIAQADTLVSCAVRFPELEGSSEWLRKGVEVINDAAREQFLPDGAHVECTPSYHNWMAAVLHSFWLLGRARPDLKLDIPSELLESAYLYALASFRPNGEMNRLHDSPCHADKAAMETGYQRFLQQTGRDTAASIPHFFPNAGQALLRDGEGERASYVTFDATPYSGGHWHPGCNSIQVDVAGRPILVDSGILDYERTNPMMAYGKSTRAHNTVSLNGWNQAPVKHVPVLYASRPGYDYVNSCYEGGYWPSRYVWNYIDGCSGGVWGQHERSMLWLHGRYILVSDTITHRLLTGSEPDIEINWQFERGNLSVDAPAFQVDTRNADANLSLRVLYKPEDAVLELHEGAQEPIRGWTASDDRLGPAPQISVTCPRAGAYVTRVVTLLAPYVGAEPPDVFATCVEGSEGRAFLITRDEVTDCVFMGPEEFHLRTGGIHFFGRVGVVRDIQAHVSFLLPGPGLLEMGDHRLEKR